MQLGEIANYDQYAPQVFKADTLSNTLIMCWIYISIGAIAIFANAINIFLFLFNKELRTNYIFHILLDFGEIINGISYISMGVGIYQEARSQNLNTYITVHDCFYKRSWPIALILGTEIPAITIMIISIERIIAVHKISLYKHYFTGKKKLLMVFLAIVLQIGILVWAAMSAMNNQSKTSTQHCAIVSSTGVGFSTFHFVFIIFANVISFFSLTIIYAIRRAHKKNINQLATTSKHGPKLIAFVVMSAVDVVFVSIPSFIMLAARFQVFAPNNIILGVTYSTTGLLSIAHTVMNYIFFSEFRRQIRILLPCLPNLSGRKSTLRSKAVATITVNTMMSTARDRSKSIPSQGQTVLSAYPPIIHLETRRVAWRTSF